MARPRIYLTGHVVIEHGARRVDEHQLPGRQGRLAFVYLASNRNRPLSRAELACAIWGDHPPPEVEGALNALLSKLRNTLKQVELEPPDTSIETRSGSISLRLPADAWIDLEAAANAIDETEGALRRADTAAAWGLANIVVAVGRRPFLTDVEAPWIETRRAAQRALLVRALACLAKGEVTPAIEVLESAPPRLINVMTRPFGSQADWLQNREKLATLYRRVGRISEAEVIETELITLLAVADDDHPIKRRLEERVRPGAATRSHLSARP